MELQKRSTCYDNYYNQYYTCNTGWNSWGRWVVFAIIVVAAFLIFFLFSCLSARRRRRRGLQPYRGTGWFAGQHGQAQYNPNYQQQQQQHAPPPAYGQNGGGYYGNPQPQVELQQPGNAYRAGDNVYEPPAGPPPKKDQTIR